MATPANNVLEDVERRRVQLEEAQSELRQALNHWSSWELEYETLKEEIQNADDPSPHQMLLNAGKLGFKHLNEKEVKDLLETSTGAKRTANQVVDVISRRVDYVQQNISTIEKQLDVAEKKLAGTSVLLEPGLETEGGLPMMDIEEELDEDGNVLSSSVSQPGKNAAEIVEVLRKAGLQRADQEEPGGAKPSNVEASSDASTQAHKEHTAPEPNTHSTSIAPQPSAAPADSPKKSVSFAEDTKPEPIVKGLSSLQSTGYNEELADYNFTRGTKVIELDDDDNEIASYPIIPQDETPEAAALRRQMLQYGLSEVGNIVAEIDLDRPVVEYSDDDEEADYDEDYDSEESEAEDKYGRTTLPVLSQEYKAEMMELEKKLNAKMMENVGPRPDLHPLAEHADDVRRLRVRKDDKDGEDVDTVVTPPAASKSSKKGVRFADNIDVSDAPQPAGRPTQALPQQPATSTPTMSNTIVERTAPAPQAPAPPSQPAKISRFKSSRASPAQQPPSAPLPTPHVPEQPPPHSGPPGRALADTVLERTPQPSDPHEPDEFDPVILNRQLQTEYHKMRNKMIQQQGGFLATDEENANPLMEEVDGKERKVSRFRAARLKAEGL
ncbi:Prefoldin subunit-domain-containing protein [Massariosphaeria phaeospora]|uniref:Prefoldin subunit-domain-containing protein n=1 Tax=Massariosphaeria phaeospora TaxID=100035 RepID=A0A7C8MII6_9PLEO|nr:Prefoldin subunit-domain-containing protein [Massariosphaeria phaeospora]